MSKMIVASFVIMQAFCIMVSRSASVVPTQVGSFVSVPSEIQETLPNQPIDTVTGFAGKYTSAFGVRETLPNLPTKQFTQAADSLSSPNEHIDAVIGLAEKYIPRETPSDFPSTLSSQISQGVNSLPSQPIVTRSYEDNDESGTGYSYNIRQVAETQAQPQQSQANISLPNPVNQAASAVTNQTGNIDPIALTQCVYRTLEQNFGRVGPVLYDLITSREGLGEDFAPITAYAAQRLGPQNIRNAVDTVINLARQVDWRSRMESLFNRVGNLRDNQTGLTMQEAFQVFRNIFDDTRAYDELRQRIQDNIGQTVTTSINVIDDSN